jgi:hypothetical protein
METHSVVERPFGPAQALELISGPPNGGCRSDITGMA